MRFYKANEADSTQKESEIIIFGKQTCLFVLENHSDLITEIYLGKEIDKKLFSKFARLQKPIIRLDSKKMQALARGGNHQNFILKIKPKQTSINIKEARRIVILVGVSDVGNIGSIVRTCLAFGVDLLVSTNEINASGVARSSSGAFFSMPCVVCKDYLSFINELKMAGFRLFGSDINGINIDSLKGKISQNGEDLSGESSSLGKWALFLGSEGEGLTKRALSKMDLTLGIKISNFDSLNVGVAAGILVYELSKLK